MEDKKFCGNGKEIKTKFGSLFKISFNKDDLKVLKENLNEAGWVNATMKQKKNPEAGKPSHYLEIDDWKPTQQPEKSPEEYNHFENDNPHKEDDDLPF